MKRWRIAIAAAAAFLTAWLGSTDVAIASRQRQPQADGYRWPRQEVLDAAVDAFRCARTAGHFDSSLLTIIDYSLPSSQRRLWVIDLARRKVLFQELVAHGRNSGAERAVAFSDRMGSKMSSLGLYRTGEVYWGKHGRSMRLDGLEPGFNRNARDRAIVMHGASYVSARSIGKLGHLGRSWGCPAVSREVHRRIIDRIQGGTALFVYYPDRRWLDRSEFLNCHDEHGTQLAGRSGRRRTLR